jgi:hypothetical protein
LAPFALRSENNVQCCFDFDDAQGAPNRFLKCPFTPHKIFAQKKQKNLEV